MIIRGTVFALIIMAAAPALVTAQRQPTTSEPQTVTSNIPPAPDIVPAKYEGGVFGYNKTQSGSLFFDDANHRLVFRDKNGKEYISLPYDAIAAAYTDSQKRRPAAATVVGSIPLIYSLPAQFIKKKYQYLTLQFMDPHSQISGVTSFKLHSREEAASVTASLAGKAGLTQHGNIYSRH